MKSREFSSVYDGANASITTRQFANAKDGSLLNISLTVSPVRDARGRIVGASKIARDITERKRAERELAKRADEQAALYEFTDNYIVPNQ
jgi:PAS domain S-box-containing protein